MDSKFGRQWIMKRKKQWLAFQLLAKMCYSIAVVTLALAIVSYAIPTPYWTYPLACLAAFAILVYATGILKVGDKEITSMLDVRFPQLQHSSALLLQPPTLLNSLGRLQAGRLQQRLPDLDSRHFVNHRSLYKPLLSLFLAGALSVIIIQHAEKQENVVPVESGLPMKSMPDQPDRAAALSDVAVVIQPPTYTGLGKRLQNELSITAPIGSSIDIQVATSAALKQVSLVVDGSEETPFSAKQGDSLQWSVSFRPQKSSYYQLSLDGERSALYPLELTPDLPVSIQVRNPIPYTVIDFGFPEVVTLDVSLTDDYGIKHAEIMATISSGKGEGVSFKSQQIALTNDIHVGKTAKIKREIDLKRLGMAAGDELYFYVKANDNSGQESRSDVFVVVLQDTSELFNMSGLVTGVDLVPEYFRSQRQIIIDTEKLISEMDTLTTIRAQQRSNDLGIDQQLLRLRYGQFLGEEAEDAIGGHAGHDHEHQGLGHLPQEELVSHSKLRAWQNHDPNHEGHENHAHEFERGETTEVPVDIETLIAEMSHQHDRAEDATFFDAEQKAHLKATLTEMWNTELRLRTYKPREALPYAYKALRLLKELQQKSRAYVGKANTKTTPLNLEKRLTADLDEINGSESTHDWPTDHAAEKTRQQLSLTLAYLSNLNVVQELDGPGASLLNDAERSIMAAAGDEPGKYLNALKALRLLKDRQTAPSEAQLALIEHAIHDLLETRNEQPTKKRPVAKQDIYQIYFDQITPR